MNFNKLLLLCFCSVALISCSPKTGRIINATSIKIPIDSNTNVWVDKSYEAYLQPFKHKIDVGMNVVIGQAAETMRGHCPESLLSNFSADVYRQTASGFTGEKVDIAVVNLGGLRTVVNAGDITIGKVFELMPFENELVVVWLRGNKLEELLQFFAKVGGEGVSGLRMEINNGKAQNISINGNPLDVNKLYSIATNDYLAAGNDKMVQLAQNEKRLNTGVKVRNMLLDYITAETHKGNKIEAKLDGRITVKNP